MNNITFFQIVTLNGSALSPRFSTYEQAIDALGYELNMGAKISKQTVYFSDSNEPGRSEFLANILTAENIFDVVAYQVSCKANKSTQPLSPLLATQKQAKAFLNKIKEVHPNAVFGKFTFEFDHADSEKRKMLLAEIQA